jgi:hypothetical protein
MVRVLDGVLARRLLLHYRVEPELARGLVKPPLAPRIRGGKAVAGVSLIHLEELGPPALRPLGLELEAMVHWLAVEGRGAHPGFAILRRDTDSRLVAALGRPLFRAPHHLARFTVEEDPRRIKLRATTAGGAGDLEVAVEFGAAFRPTQSFVSLADAERFLGGIGAALAEAEAGSVLEAVRLRQVPQGFEPVRLLGAVASFFEDRDRFPAGGAVLDGALAMRALPLEYARVPLAAAAEPAALAGAPGLP